MPLYITITVLEQLSNFYTACSCLPADIIGLLDLM